MLTETRMWVSCPLSAISHWGVTRQHFGRYGPGLQTHTRVAQYEGRSLGAYRRNGIPTGCPKAAQKVPEDPGGKEQHNAGTFVYRWGCMGRQEVTREKASHSRRSRAEKHNRQPPTRANRLA